MPLPTARPQLEMMDVGALWMTAMRRGDFPAAWRATDTLELPRREQERAGYLVRQPHHLQWNGEPLAGRRVLIRCEHGLGDAIQFLRYGARLQATGAAVTVRVPPALLTLVRGMDGLDRVCDGWTTEPEPPHDVAIECMELPYAFRDTPETLPGEVPYLPVAQLAADSLLPPLPAGEGLKVGLIWAASSWDPTRSLRLAHLAPLAAISGRIRFFSLQQGPELKELADAPFPIVSLSEHTGELHEAAAALLQMDLVLAVDGMMAHLAGALGRPAWVLLKHDADWRWMDDRADSPWYPTMRLFRQPAPGAWAPVIGQVAAQLGKLAVHR